MKGKIIRTKTATERLHKKLFIVDSSETKQIQQWTNKTFGEIIFDSVFDDWDEQSSIFNDIIQNRSNLLFIVEDMNENHVGCYFSSEIPSNKTDLWIPSTKRTFVFQSQRVNKKYNMMKYNIKNERYGCICYNSNDNCLIGFGVGHGLCVYKKSFSDNSYINFSNNHFSNCKNDENNEKVEIIPKRIVVVQMI